MFWTDVIYGGFCELELDPQTTAYLQNILQGLCFKVSTLSKEQELCTQVLWNFTPR